MTKSVWTPFESQLHLLLSSWTWDGQRFLVAFSGGLDSSCLLQVLFHLRSAHGFDLAAAHIHHGRGPEREYRDEALEFCKEQCTRLGISFYERISPSCLESEQDCREFRQSALREIATREGYEVLVTAHHSDDLLETRLIRLIRGTGPQGLLSMTTFDGQVLRPFLKVSRKDLEAYQRQSSVPYLQDPTNVKTSYLRNWIRHQWLPSLEVQHPGGCDKMAQSLDLIAQAWEPLMTPSTNTISWGEYLLLSHREQKQWVARALHVLGVVDFSHSQVLEILKNLDKPENAHSFLVAGCVWSVNAQQITVRQRGTS